MDDMHKSQSPLMSAHSSCQHTIKNIRKAPKYVMLALVLLLVYNQPKLTCVAKSKATV